MYGLFKRQADYYINNQILITYFSYKENGLLKFRIYFVDLNTGYMHNPLIVEFDEAKGHTVGKGYVSHITLESALKWIFVEIETYLSK